MLVDAPASKSVLSTLMHPTYVCAHRRGRGDKHKIDILLFVTTRSIAHSGRFVYIRKCVDEFNTDTGQPLVTSNVMSNHLSYHHKTYYTYIEMCIQMYNAYGHLAEFSISNKTYHSCYQKDRISSRSVSMHSY